MRLSDCVRGHVPCVCARACVRVCACMLFFKLQQNGNYFNRLHNFGVFMVFLQIICAQHTSVFI